MDFLSYQVLCEQKDSVVVGFQDCIVLNSTSLVNKTIPFIDVYDKVYCFLDNDEAGRGAAAQIGELLFGKVESRAQLYAGYNDLNDYLRGIKQP